MKYQVAMWAAVGLFVSIFWAVYSAATPLAFHPLAWTLAQITCPIAYASFYFHFPVSVYWALCANSAFYGLLGFVIESLRRNPKQAD